MATTRDAKMKKTTPAKNAAPPPKGTPAPVAAPRVRVAPAAPTSDNPAVQAAHNSTKVVEGADAVKAADDVVQVSCPNGFNLTLDDHSQVHYPAGTARMPRAHAEHWYAKNNAVEILD